MRKQLRLSGSGGQGVITAAIILAEAAVDEGKEAVQSQSYGPEARGGASKSEVIIDDAPIYHPHVQVPDLVLALTQKAAPEVPDFPHVVRIPFTQLAVEQCGRKLFTNIVALGALVRLTGIVEYETIKKAVAHRVPPATVEKNMQALQVGWDAAAK